MEWSIIDQTTDLISPLTLAYIKFNFFVSTLKDLFIQKFRRWLIGNNMILNKADYAYKIWFLTIKWPIFYQVQQK